MCKAPLYNKVLVYSKEQLLDFRHKSKKLLVNNETNKDIDYFAIVEKVKRGSKAGIRNQQINKIKNVISTKSIQAENNSQNGLNSKNLLHIRVEEKCENNFHSPVVFCANARSLTNKIDELSVVLEQNDVSVAILTETWLNENQPNEGYDIDGYNIIRNDRNKGRGGGVCVYLKMKFHLNSGSSFKQTHKKPYGLQYNHSDCQKRFLV